MDKKDSILECCEALNEDDIVSRVTCGSEETRNFDWLVGWLVWDLLAQEPNLAMLRQTYGESTAYGLTRNFEECPESDEENLVTHQKLSHGDALVHTEALLNYLEQEDDSTSSKKIILRNLHSIIRRRVNEKRKQTSMISFFTKQ
ncbi:hypothetical protein AVEN_150767-1 [Araneus ventricosus]|uniref:Uncharacterized protein n=1 Tax=Araneus ventricosus TaxID=182803 RepID=A0A4Y2FHF9_ARAVE|nr:hypothetical protein AVEN_150767-1 [Araneus ventricosus]